MPFLNEVLDPPSYGFERNGQFYKPSQKEILREFFSRLNVFADRRNWLSFTFWFFTLALAVPFFIFLFKYFSWPLLILGLVYSMAFLGSSGTVWFHRYSTHHAFVFRNSIWRFFCRNMSIKIIPEEAYVISHHVHHYISEKPGDPYNVYGGFLYCFLADANHQIVARNLSRENYAKVSTLIGHTGVHINSYEQYLKWGSLCHPVYTIIHYLLNWAFWYGAFYLIGGHALATAIFGLSVIWAVGIRTFNYDGHGRGRDRRRDGIDFNRADLSVNQVWPGYVGGEWHNNHHLFPNGARSGFLPYQFDSPWLFIRFYHFIGGISYFRDHKKKFMEKHYLPYLMSKKVLKRDSSATAAKQKITSSATNS
ncbi:MAG TPA: fatty acid desaturase [bacterium]